MGRDPIPRRRSFPGAPMRGPRSTRYQPRFPAVVPVRGEGRSRVTHPFATLYAAGAALTVRLACVRHAASVHPEPGSNSSFGRPLEGRLSSNQNKEKAIGMMVGTRNRAPHGIGLSSEISAGILAGGGPARVPIRFPRYPVFKVPGASSAPPRRFLPSAAQGDILRDLSPAVKGLSRLFPGKGRLKGRFSRTTWGDALLVPFVPSTHLLHKPRKGAGRRECDPAFRGASPQGAPRRRGIPSALRRRPLLCKEAGRLSLRPASQIDR